MSEQDTTDTEAQPKNWSLLAQEHFGGEFHGEVKQPESPEGGEEIDDAETSGQEETDEQEQPQESSGTEDQEEHEETDEVDSEDDGEPIKSISELADYLKNEHELDVDSDFFDNLKIPAKVNGQETEFTLKDLRDSAQKYQAADQYLEQAKTKSKEAQQQTEQQLHQLNEQFNTTATLIQEAEKLLDAESSQIDWQSLRENDPAEYSAKKAELQEKRDNLNQIKTQASTEYQNWLQQQEKQRQTIFAEQIQAEHQALLEKLPEWQKDDVQKEEKAKLAEYLQKNGFNNDEIGQAADHRLIILARKAMLYDQSSKGTEEAKKKKVAKIPKTMKSGSPKTKQQSNQAELDRLRQKVKETSGQAQLEAAHAYNQAKKQARS